MHDLYRLRQPADVHETGATVIADHAQDPERYGVAMFHAAGKVCSIEEKPRRPFIATLERRQDLKK